MVPLGDLAGGDSVDVVGAISLKLRLRLAELRGARAVEVEGRSQLSCVGSRNELRCNNGLDGRRDERQGKSGSCDRNAAANLAVPLMDSHITGPLS